jgi:undecaprenyl-diphosphatase
MEPRQQNHPHRWMAWVKSHLHQEYSFLLTLALITGGIWLFIYLAGEVGAGDTTTFDRQVLLALRNPHDPKDPLGPRWAQEMGRDLTALGGVTILLSLTVMVTGFLLLQKKQHAALLVAIATGGAYLFSSLLKEFYDRPRPDLVPHGSYVTSSSFPSGHSMLAAAVYLTLAALLSRVYARRRVQLYLLSWATLLTVAVGLSRVYLGVHWPTDVLSGWTAGAVWALLCSLLARYLQRRGQIEKPERDAPQEAGSSP